MSYNYRNSKSNVINILKSPTKIEKKDNIPQNDSEFTYENGIICWTSAIFIDIKDSTKLFQSRDEKLARLMRAFTSEIITIFQESDRYRQIGIRGDCVYGIYTASQKDDLVELFRIAYKTNTFMSMLNKIISNYNYEPIIAGIGLGCDEELIIKAGRTGTGINDKIWIGKAIVDASNLSSKANRNGIEAIAMSEVYWNNIKEILFKENDNYRNWVKSKRVDPYYSSSGIECYHCSIIQSDFFEWINNGMKD